ncbi:hypothetical protein ISP15_18010 [Dyella jejuensis]|uniref:DUF3592 domain-containing protein n=1 Tax=Dyella jejuensis TaxID=1432009 RepID=A0ABW8JQV9_9GAMM
MRNSAVKYLFLGIGSFVLSFAVLALVICHYAPIPSAGDFNHHYEVTGRYRYNRASRGGNATWLDNKLLNCRVSALDEDACLGQLNAVPKGAILTVDFVHLKTISGYMALAMSINSSSEKIFFQSPEQCINSWLYDSAFSIAMAALIFSALIVSFTKIGSNYLSIAKGENP